MDTNEATLSAVSAAADMADEQVNSQVEDQQYAWHRRFIAELGEQGYAIVPVPPMEEQADSKVYDWWGWSAETDYDNGGRANVWHLTIVCHDEEYAVITHRTCPDEEGIETYPLNGHVAQEKIERAKWIVAALNASTRFCEDCDGVSDHADGCVHS